MALNRAAVNRWTGKIDDYLLVNALGLSTCVNGEDLIKILGMSDTTFTKLKRLGVLAYETEGPFRKRYHLGKVRASILNSVRESQADDAKREASRSECSRLSVAQLRERAALAVKEEYRDSILEEADRSWRAGDLARACELYREYIFKADEIERICRENV